jgi:hypothetical protein
MCITIAHRATARRAEEGRETEISLSLSSSCKVCPLTPLIKEEENKKTGLSTPHINPILNM